MNAYVWAVGQTNVNKSPAKLNLSEKEAAAKKAVAEEGAAPAANAGTNLSIESAVALGIEWGGHRAGRGSGDRLQ